MTQKGSAGKLFEGNIEVVDSIVEQLKKEKRIQVGNKRARLCR